MAVFKNMLMIYFLECIANEVCGNCVMQYVILFFHELMVFLAVCKRAVSEIYL